MLFWYTVLHQKIWLASCRLANKSHPQSRIAPYNVSQSLHRKDLAVFDVVDVICETCCSVHTNTHGKEAALLFSNGSPPFGILTYLS